MKKILVIFLIIMSVAGMANANSKKGAEITFKVTTHDFGYIQEKNGPVAYDFNFENTGDAPLIIVSANASCGCTKPSYPKKPIAPGESGIIKVTFKPKHRPGAFNKVVTVNTNANSKHLRIKGNVIPEQ